MDRPPGRRRVSGLIPRQEEGNADQGVKYLRATFPAPRLGRERLGSADDHDRDQSGMTETGEITVVIITRDRRSELARTLRRLRDLPERPPVIVVDNGSSDGTPEMLRSHFGDVEVIALGRNAGGAGRNAGVAVATTRFVAFCDDDTWWSPGSLAAAETLLASWPELAVVTARIIVEPDGVVDPICEEMAASPLPSPELPGTPLLSFLAGASVVRRDAFLATGGFNPQLLIGGEEELLAADLAEAGWAMAYVPELEIHHDASGHRDAHLRRRQGIRNTLWFTWLRRPPGSAWRRTRALALTLPRDRVSAAAMVDTLRGMPWVLRNRRCLGPVVESGLRLLEESQLRSGARRYVS